MLKKIWKHKSIQTLWNWEFFRFLFAGAINTLFGYAIFVLAILVGIHYAIAIIISTVTGSIFNYFSYGIIAFRILDKKIVLRFIILYAVLYFFNLAIFKLFLLITSNKIVVGAMCLPIMVAVTYFSSKKFVYNKKNGKKEKTDQHHDSLLQ